MYFNTPLPLELKKKFSDGSPRFEFEWVISGQICKIDLALKSKFTRENLRFSKTFQTGLGVLSSRGGVLKYTKTVKIRYSKLIWNSHQNNTIFLTFFVVLLISKKMKFSNFQLL